MKYPSRLEIFYTVKPLYKGYQFAGRILSFVESQFRWKSMYNGSFAEGVSIFGREIHGMIVPVAYNIIVVDLISILSYVLGVCFKCQ